MKKIFWSIGLALLSVFAILMIFLLSNSGLKLGLLIGKSFLPGELHYQKAIGLITGPIELQGVDYRQGSHEIRIQSLKFNWNLWGLFVKRLSFSEINADRMVIIDHHVTQSTPAAPFDFSLFYKQNPFEAYTEKANKMARAYTRILKGFTWSWDIKLQKSQLGPIIYYSGKDRVLELTHLKLSGELSKRKTNFSLDTISSFPYATHIQASILGNSQDYQFSFSTLGKQMNFKIRGQGNDHHIQLSTTRTSVLNGVLQGNLTLDWEKDLIWNTDINVKDVNFADFYPQWSRDFQASIQSQGNLSEENPAFNLRTWIKTSRAKIDLNIQHTNAWLATWNISLANGKYQSEGNLTGPFHDPNTKGIFSIQNFAYKDYLAKQVDIQWNLNLNQASPAHITISANQFSSGKFFAKKINAIFSGTLKQHEISLAAVFEKSSTQIMMSGALQGKIWSLNCHRWQWGNFQLPVQDTLNLQITLPDYNGGIPKENSKIDATLHANLTDLAFISDLLPDLDVEKGRIGGTLHLTGTLAKPLLSGELDFSHGDLEIPAWDLKLHHANITSSATGHVVNYTAHAISGKNPVTIIGDTDFSEKGIPTHLKLSGNTILLVDTPEYTIYGTPHVDATITGTTLDLKGDITIPNGLIRPHDFRNTTLLPPDEVTFVGTPKVVGQSHWQINSNLNIIAGDHVIIDAFGIHGFLEGSVHIVQTPNQTLLANGKIGIHHGLYRAYGHQLKISHGSFMQFTNSPINNPVLSIEATRKVTANAGSQIQSFASEKIIVGMNIHGPLSNPDINLFSSSGNLSQSDILSYILTGAASSNSPLFGAPNNLNGRGNFSYTSNILDALKLGASGVGGTDSLLDKIQSGLGFSELGIESDTTIDPLGNPLGNQTNFVIGRHLSKDLYLRYTRGIYGPGLLQENLVTLRYLFRRNWAIQLESSEFSNSAVWGADILYTTERN